MKDNVNLFSGKVDSYSKYRPSYPPEVIGYLESTFGLSRDSIVADVGSGTGLFTKLLLDRVKTVYAIEPNGEMREEAEKRLKKMRPFVSINGTAEKMQIGSSLVNFITAAQSFHLFDPDMAKEEFRRVLKRDGQVILIWNKRLQNTDFLVDYENIIKSTIPEYRDTTGNAVTHEALRSFLGKDMKVSKFNNNQVFNWDGVLGRLNSSSYIPGKNTQEYQNLERNLRAAFVKYSVNEKIQFNYSTEVYSGQP